MVPRPAGASFLLPGFFFALVLGATEFALTVAVADYCVDPNESVGGRAFTFFCGTQRNGVLMDRAAAHYFGGEPVPDYYIYCVPTAPGVFAPNFAAAQAQLTAAYGALRQLGEADVNVVRRFFQSTVGVGGVPELC